MNIDASLFLMELACVWTCACVIKKEKEQRMHDEVSCCRHLGNNQCGPPSFLLDPLLAAESSARRHRQEVAHCDMIDKWRGRLKTRAENVRIHSLIYFRL